MNFEDWFKKYSSKLYDSPSLDGLAKDAWKACKEEVLKILNRNMVRPDLWDKYEYIDPSVINEIEKL